MIPLTIQAYVGRERTAAFVDDVLKHEPGALVAIEGLGGIGKTSFVANYVTSRFEADTVMWISCHELLDQGSILRSNLEVLATSNRLPSVVVVDGLDEFSSEITPTVLEEFTQRVPNVPLIITSRRSILLQHAHHLSLSTLSIEEAINVLEIRSGKKIDRIIAEKLALSVQNHPLALNLLGALLEVKSPSDLLNEMDGELFTLHQASELPENGIIEIVRPHIIEVSDFLVEHLKRQPHDLYVLQPRNFEELVARLLEDQGWEVTLTKQTRDGGRDILAFLKTDVGRFLCLIEAKKFAPSRPVGVELVRGLYGVFCDHQANSAILVTTSRFTADAREFQQRHSYQLALRDYWDVVAWIKKYRGKSHPH